MVLKCLPDPQSNIITKDKILILKLSTHFYLPFLLQLEVSLQRFLKSKRRIFTVIRNQRCATRNMSKIYRV